MSDEYDGVVEAVLLPALLSTVGLCVLAFGIVGAPKGVGATLVAVLLLKSAAALGLRDHG